MAAESTHAHQATVEDDAIKLRYCQIVPFDLRLVDHGAAHDAIGPLQRRMGTDLVSTIGGSGCAATLPRISGCGRILHSSGTSYVISHKPRMTSRTRVLTSLEEVSASRSGLVWSR